MTEPNRCPQCGAEIAADAPEGLCPNCLLQAGLQTDVASAGPEPAATSPHGARFVPPSPEELAPHFPQLEILELLGQGGMGAVYKARQPGLDRLVALKILPREVGSDPDFAERFTREARALARLSHPHIVAVYDFGQAAGFCYFLMEYVDGVNLRQMLAAGQLEPRQALAIVPQICEALQFAHEEGIVHRDIKPENVLVDRKGRVRIADFGLAKLLGRPAADFTLTGTGQVMGTPHYMAPEQIEHPQQVDHRADIYSLGVVFYEMLTGELPLGRFAPPSKKVEVDVRLDEVVLRALEKEPERRYQQASEVKTDVETIACGAEPAAPVAKPAATPAAPPDLEEVRGQVRGPAIGLLITGILNCLIAPPVVLVLLLALGTAPSLLFLIVGLMLGILTIVGAVKMLRLSSYGWAMSASILALLPCGPATLLGLAMGIWALVVLGRPEVKAAFRSRRRYQQPSEVSSDVEAVARGVVTTGGAPTGESPHPGPLPGGEGAEAGSPFAPGSQPGAAPPDLEEVRGQVKGPAIGLLITGILNCLIGFPLLLVFLGFVAAAGLVVWPSSREPKFIEMSQDLNPKDVPPGPRPEPQVIERFEEPADTLPPGAGPPPRDAPWSGDLKTHRGEFNPAPRGMEGDSREWTRRGERPTPPRSSSAASGVELWPILLSLLLFIVLLIAALMPGLLTIVGAVKMMRLSSYGWAMTASVLALLPCGPATLLGLAMGIWALVVLSRPEVKAAFQARRRRQQPSEVKGDAGAVARGVATAAGAPPGESPRPGPLPEAAGAEARSPFAAGAQPAPAPPDLEEVRGQVKGPAIGLLITGILNCLIGLPVLLVFVVAGLAVVARQDKLEPQVIKGFEQDDLPVPTETRSHPDLERPPSREIMHPGFDHLPPSTKNGYTPGPGEKPPEAPDGSHAEGLKTHRGEFNPAASAPVADSRPWSSRGERATGPARSEPPIGSLEIFPLVLSLLVFIGLLIAALMPGLLTIVGAVKMMRLSSYGWAMTASVLALLPCSPAGLLGLAMGIWALIVLSRPAVKAAFQAQKAGHPLPAGAAAPRKGLSIGCLVALLVAVVLALVCLVPAALVAIKFIGWRTGDVPARHAPVQQPERPTPPSPKAPDPDEDLTISFKNRWEKLLTKTGVELDQGIVSGPGQWASLKVVADGPTVVRLFETGPSVRDMAMGRPFDAVTLTYRAKLRTREFQGEAYLEMLGEFPGQGEKSSRSADAPGGSTDWTTAEAHLFSKGREWPDNVKLNLVINGKGTVWIDDVRLRLNPPSPRGR